MGKSSRRKRSKSPRSHKRKRDSSRDSSGDGRRPRRSDKYRSHSREASLSISVDRILAVLAEQGNRIALIEANAHVPVAGPADTSGVFSSPCTEGLLPADNRAVQEVQDNLGERSRGPDTVSLQAQSDQPEEVRSTPPVASGPQAEGKRLKEVSDGSLEPGRRTRCVPLSTLFCWFVRKLV